MTLDIKASYRRLAQQCADVDWSKTSALATLGSDQIEVHLECCRNPAGKKALSAALVTALRAESEARA